MSKKRVNREAYKESRAWARKRRVYFLRYGGCCVVCGALADHLHHRSYERLGRERISDLVALCSSCHETAHRLLSETSSSDRRRLGISLWTCHEYVFGDRRCCDPSRRLTEAVAVHDQLDQAMDDAVALDGRTTLLV